MKEQYEMTYSGRMEDGWSSPLAVLRYILSWLLLARSPVPCRVGWRYGCRIKQWRKGGGWGEGSYASRTFWIKIMSLEAIIYVLQQRFPVHHTFKALSSPDPHLELTGAPESLPPSPSLRLREALQVTFIDIQTPQAPMVLFPQPTRRVIKAPSSHLPSLGLGTGFGSLPWMWSRNPQGDFSGHLPFTLFTTQLDTRHTLCWAEPSPPGTTSGQPRVPCPGKREKRVQAVY